MRGVDVGGGVRVRAPFVSLSLALLPAALLLLALCSGDVAAQTVAQNKCTSNFTVQNTCPGSGYVYTTSSGTLTSGGTSYYPSSCCFWILQPGSAQSITITFSALDIENTYDYVRVFATGTSSTQWGAQLAEYTGSSLPASATFAFPTITVLFSSDSSHQGAGFTLSYSSSSSSVTPYNQCSGFTNVNPCSGSGSIATSSSGTVSTSTYLNSMCCYWIIQPSSLTAGYNITISFSSLGTESGFDFVRLYPLLNPLSSIGSTGSALSVSGTSLPPTTNINAPAVLVRFTTDGSGISTGFSLSYSISATTGPTLTSISNKCTSNYTVQNSCTNSASTLTSTSGSFGTGVGYSNSQCCFWVVQPASAQSITLTFSTFSLGSGDFVRVFAPGSVNSLFGAQIGQYSGTSLPSSVTYYYPTVTVLFSSDASTTGTGFTASYSRSTSAPSISNKCTGFTSQNSCPSSGTQLTAESGTITDGSGSYPASACCFWVIQPTMQEGDNITLTFSSFNLENTYDFVKVYAYDSPTTTSFSTLLGSYTGSLAAQTVSFAAAAVVVAFTSDGSVQEEGFSITYAHTINGAAYSSSSGSSPTNSVVDKCTSNFTVLNTCTNSRTIATSTTGSISVGSYSNSQCCFWILQPASAQSITLTFSTFSLGSGDYVRVFAPGSNSSGWGVQLAQYTGSSLPSSATFYYPWITVEFMSDTSTTSTGFTMSYTSSSSAISIGNKCSSSSYTYQNWCSDSGTMLTARSGSLDDGFGTYSNSECCFWVIRPVNMTTADAITLTVDSINLESCCDFLRVYTMADPTATSNTGTLLATVTSSSTSSQLTFAYPAIVVMFTTDSSVTRDGFSVRYGVNGNYGGYTVSLDGGAIAGIVVGSIAGVGFLIGCICCIRKRCSCPKRTTYVAPPAPAPVVPNPVPVPTPTPVPAPVAAPAPVPARPVVPPAQERWSVRKPGRLYGGCKLDGCTLPRQIDPATGFVQDACCYEHAVYNGANRATAKCQLPGCDVLAALDERTMTMFNYCCLTHDVMDRQRLLGAMCVPLVSNDYEWKAVSYQYYKKWLKGVARPFTAVLKVRSPPHLLTQFDAYRAKVTGDDPVVYGAGGPGNVQRRWHGTSVNCSLGLNGNMTPCSDRQCRCCNILQNGFDIQAVRQLNHWARFGPGHYFSATTSKSAEYPLKLAPGQRRVLFLVKLVLGRGEHLAQNDGARSGPKAGYHSVLGEVGQHLNYDECVVYRDDAAVIRYIFM